MVNLEHPDLPYRAGFGKASVTSYEPGWCLFGWGHPANVAEGVATELFARAFVLEERATGRRIAYVCCDLGMISEALRHSVVQRVCGPQTGLSEHDVMITATHTHSAASGYSTYIFYALSGPGVSQRVIDELAQGIADAITMAVKAMSPVKAWLTSGWVPASEPVAFNRSLIAYNRNEDVTPLTEERRDEAIDRTMTLLRIDDAEGNPKGLVSWFPVHGTSVHSENRLIHGDNKGCAAADCESWARARGYQDFVAIFAQESAGDVTPNYRWNASRQKMIGRYDDDYESAQFNGEVQSRHARALWSHAPESEPLGGPVDSALRYRDFFSLRADDQFAPGIDARTSKPRIGATMGVGTMEGGGPFFALRDIVPWLNRFQAIRAKRYPKESWETPHGTKFPFWDLGDGLDNKILGTLPVVNPILYLLADRNAKYYRRAMRWPFARESWVPRRLPLQQLRIGPLVIAGLPIEPTTVAGRRMRQTITQGWAGETLSRVVINGYANAYCGYLTTPEEYDAQCYEGAMTLYGKWSLPVYCTELLRMTEAMREGQSGATLGEVPLEVAPETCLAA